MGLQISAINRAVMIHTWLPADVLSFSKPTIRCTIRPPLYMAIYGYMPGCWQRKQSTTPCLQWPTCLCWVCPNTCVILLHKEMQTAAKMVMSVFSAFLHDCHSDQTVMCVSAGFSHNNSKVPCWWYPPRSKYVCGHAYMKVVAAHAATQDKWHTNTNHIIHNCNIELINIVNVYHNACLWQPINDRYQLHHLPHLSGVHVVKPVEYY